MADEATTTTAPVITQPTNTASPATPETPATTTTATPPVLALTPEEYRQWQDDRTRLAQHDAELAKERAAAKEREFKTLTEKGEIEKAMQLYRHESDERLNAEKRAAQERVEAEKRASQQLKETSDRTIADRDNMLRATEARARKFALDGELGRAMASHNLMDGAAAKIVKDIKDEFVVEPNGETFTVRTSTGQNAADFLTSYLQANSYFVKAQNPGGGTGGVQPSQQSPPSGPANPAGELTPQQKFSQAIVANPNMSEGERIRLAGELGLYAQKNTTSHDQARGNMTLPMGLRRIG